MEDDSERNRKNRELCDAVIELLEFPEAGTATYLTHTFFIRTIRENRLAGVSLEHVAQRGLKIYPVWMIQSRKSVAFLLKGKADFLEDVKMFIRQARAHSPRLESCAFFLKEDLERFTSQVKKATNLQPISSQIAVSTAYPDVHGWIYPDRAFTMIRFATRPIGVTSQDVETPHGHTAQSS